MPIPVETAAGSRDQRQATTASKTGLAMNPAVVVSASKAFSAASKAYLASNRDFGVRAGMLVDAASKAAWAMNADLAMQASLNLSWPSLKLCPRVPGVTSTRRRFPG